MQEAPPHNALIPPTPEEKAEQRTTELRIAFVLLVRQVGEKEARRRVQGHDKELLAMVDILIKEQPTISITQVARDIHGAFGDRYTATADSVEMRIRRLMKLRAAAK